MYLCAMLQGILRGDRYLGRSGWSIDGVVGSRITGGGFGGCTVSIVKNDAVDAFMEKVGAGYKEKTGIDAEFYVVDIGDGARRTV